MKQVEITNLAINWFNARSNACTVGGLDNLNKLADAEAALAEYVGNIIRSDRETS